jgi:hypothetical protein
VRCAGPPITRSWPRSSPLSTANLKPVNPLEVDGEIDEGCDIVESAKNSFLLLIAAMLLFGLRRRQYRPRAQ